ncbi:neuronal vesicle trafficking-associated protein 1-like isoform X2 [Halichoeres trimaculatus]|uniref:neuronal vesicle trafficking-associated protein 1-like isoform X2 n=1 Tax=Halichoeres trimaculatus TaxID=147232 RepID=UPI003D9E85C6
MVKLGTNLSDKLEKQPSADDGFDNIPLITPLEVNQLQKSFADKVIVKTAQYQQQKKKKNEPMSNIKKLTFNFCISHKAKTTGHILITLVFLIILLHMFKTMWYDQLTCPKGFILKQKHCTPLETYYTAQQQEQQQELGVHGGPNTGLYAALCHLRQMKRAGPELPPPSLPVISALREMEVEKQDGEVVERVLQEGD